jgi:hypothetical protein
MPGVLFSKKLKPAQQKYSTYDRELLAIYKAISAGRFQHLFCQLIYNMITRYRKRVGTQCFCKRSRTGNHSAVMLDVSSKVYTPVFIPGSSWMGGWVHLNLLLIDLRWRGWLQCSC